MTDPTPQAMLSAYLAAEQKIATGGVLEVRVADRLFRATDLKEIRAGVAYWQRRVNAQNGQPANALASFV